MDIAQNHFIISWNIECIKHFQQVWCAILHISITDNAIWIIFILFLHGGGKSNNLHSQPTKGHYKYAEALDLKTQDKHQVKYLMHQIEAKGSSNMLCLSINRINHSVVYKVHI